MLAASPLAVTRSAPTITTSTFAALHQMTARIVGNDRVWNTVAAKLEGRERRTLVAWSRLVDPYVDREPDVMRAVDRGRGGAPVYGGEPTRIAVRENIQALACLLLGEQPFKQAQAMQANRRLVATSSSAMRAARAYAAATRDCARKMLHDALHFLEGPAQIHGRGPLAGKKRDGMSEAIIGRVVAKSEAQAIGGGDADQRRAPHLHRDMARAASCTVVKRTVSKTCGSLV